MKKLLAACAVLTVLWGSSASAAELSIKGSIVPSACAVKLGDNGVVTYNYTSAEAMNLHKTFDAYLAPERNIFMSVQCATPSRVSISLEDNKAPTKFSINDGQDMIGYGLGSGSVGQKIGQFRVNFAKLKGTSTLGGTLQTPQHFLMQALGNNRDFWTSSLEVTPQYFIPGYRFAFDLDGLGAGPSPVSKIEGDLSVFTFFNSALIDNLNETLQLDGSATFHLHYN